MKIPYTIILFHALLAHAHQPTPGSNQPPANQGDALPKKTVAAQLSEWKKVWDGIQAKKLKQHEIETILRASFGQ